MAKKLNRLNKFGNKTGITVYSSAAVLLGALLSHQVYAQNQQGAELETTPVGAVDTAEDKVVATPPESEEVAEVEEIVVYGIKQSLSTAQDMKRDASTVMDAVTASDIMSLPDKSVVDALTRVPGVTVEVFEATDDPEHFGAEGSSALIRGLDRTLTQFNGRTSFSATQWGSLNLSHIPSELVSAIEVQKNQTASMIEGGIAGTMNLVTRKPFDSAGMQLGGSIKTDYADLAEEWSPSISGLFSNRWDTNIGEVGFLVSLSLSETHSKSEAIGTHDYYERSNRKNPDGPDEDSEPDDIPYVGPPLDSLNPNAVYWQPPSIQARVKEDERDRLGFVSSLQWQNPDETILATLEFIRSDGHAVWTERLAQNKDQLGSQFGNTDVVKVVEIPGLSGLNESFDPATGLFTHGVLTQAGSDVYGYAPETRYHDEETYVNDLSFDIEWKVTDNLTLDGDLQYVDSGQVMFDHTIHSFYKSDVWMDFRSKDQPQIGFLGENFHLLTPTELATGRGSVFQDANGSYWGGDLTSITNPENVHTRSAMDHNTDSKGDALAFAINADYEFEEGWITNIKAGFRVSNRDQVHKSTEYDWGVISPEWSESDRRSVADYPQFQEMWDFGSDFHDGDAFVPGSVTAFYFPKLEWVKDLGGFENAFRSIVPSTYDPAIAALPISDEYPLNDPRRDNTFEYTAEDGADDPFITLEARPVEGKAPGSPYAPLYIFEVKERKTAAYVQLDFDFIDLPMPVRGNLGLRYVDIDVSTIGSRIFDTPENSGTWSDPKRYYSGTVLNNFPEDLEEYLLYNAAEYERSVAENDTPNYRSPSELEWLNGYSERVVVKPERFTTVLPSLNLTMNITDDLLLRFAASKALYVPHLSLKRAGQSLKVDVTSSAVPEAEYPSDWGDDRGQPIASADFLTYTSETVNGSNPYLVPEESINVDLGVEWYFSEVGSVTGVVFLKDMDNLIRKTSTRLETDNPASGVTNTLLQSETYENVGKAQIHGFELSYQQVFDMLPGFWSGLGIQSNYTHLYTSEDVQAAVDTSVFGTFVDLPLEGLSPENYNIILFYENDKISTRFAYNFRSEYMLNARDVIGKRPVYNTDRAVLDYSFTYTVADNIKVGFDINNLLDEQTETMYQYNQEGDLHPRNYFVNDRRVTFRLSGSF